MLPADAAKTLTETSVPETPSDETPHYHGHRARPRERFQSAGANALSDYELMEIVLFAAQPRREVKPLPKALLKAFQLVRGGRARTRDAAARS